MKVFFLQGLLLVLWVGVLYACPSSPAYQFDFRLGKDVKQIGWFQVDRQGRIYQAGKRVRDPKLAVDPDLAGPRGVERGHSGISEEDFHRVIAEVTAPYYAFAEHHGAQLEIFTMWEHHMVNALAAQLENSWRILFLGGLARREGMTADGFAFVVCHELGHHFAGFPLYNEDLLEWAASEGQADYFAAQTCLRDYFTSTVEQMNLNVLAPQNLDSLSDEDSRAQLTSRCSLASGLNPNVHDYGLCIRVGLASKSVADVLAILGGHDVMPEFHTPDMNQVASTYISHSDPQCRLDTGFSAALCSIDSLKHLEYYSIPGKAYQYSSGDSDLKLKFQEREAAQFSCHPIMQDAEPGLMLWNQFSFPFLDAGNWGYRPACWFSSGLIQGPYL